VRKDFHLYLLMNEKAKITLQEAEIICKIECCANSVANRYYFAVLQSMFAFAERNGYSLPRSKGGNHKWALTITKPYLQTHRAFRTFQRLMRLRVKADYEPAPVIMDDFSEAFIAEIIRTFNIFILKGE